jgi:hypothetical protein
MKKENRRQFFGSLLGATGGATTMLSVGALPAMAAADLAEPDLIVFDGTVFTMEESSPRAESLRCEERPLHRHWQLQRRS